MLSKTATMLLGLINSEPLNAYEIIKTLLIFKNKNLQNTVIKHNFFKNTKQFHIRHYIQQY